MQTEVKFLVNQLTATKLENEKMQKEIKFMYDRLAESVSSAKEAEKVPERAPEIP